MTRKKFIKLLMSHGYQRNLANYFAQEALANYKSYQNAWDRYYKIKLIIDKIKDDACNAFQVFIENISNLIVSVEHLASAVADMHDIP